MADHPPAFDANTKVVVFDALTVLVMLEHCEPDLTVVEWWNCLCSPPVHMRTCMQCTMHLHATNRLNGRPEVLEAVKAGTMQIVSIEPRDGLFLCPRCDARKRNLAWEAHVYRR